MVKFEVIAGGAYLACAGGAHDHGAEFAHGGRFTCEQYLFVNSIKQLN